MGSYCRNSTGHGQGPRTRALVLLRCQCAFRDPAGQTGLVADRARDPAGGPKSLTRSHTSSPLRQTGWLINWSFRNRQTGQITVAQYPNVLLWIFLLTVMLRWVVPTGTAACTALD